MNFGTGGQTGSASQTNCWLTSTEPPQGFTQTVIKSAFFVGGYQAPGPVHHAGRTIERADPHRHFVGDPVYRRQPADRRDLLLDDLGRAARAARPAHRRLRAPAPPAGLLITPSMKPAT